MKFDKKVLTCSQMLILYKHGDGHFVLENKLFDS